MRHRKRSSRGAALVEGALVIPMLVLLMLNMINFGMYIYAWVTINNTARALLEYRVYTGVVLGFPASPSASQMETVVTTETSTLPNHGGSGVITWGIKGNANGTATGNEGPGPYPTCDSDPVSPTRYTRYCARVSYDFTPLISGLTISFPAVTRVVSMRSMQ